LLDCEVPGHVEHSSCSADAEAELDEKLVVVTAMLVFLERSGDVEDNVGLDSVTDSSPIGLMFELFDGVERQESLESTVGIIKGCNSLLIVGDEVIGSRGAGTSGGELAPLDSRVKSFLILAGCLFFEQQLPKSCLECRIVPAAD